MMFMDEWSSNLGHGSMYGFLEPHSIHNTKDRRGQCQDYIERCVKESQREVYLGVYLNRAHWQLVVLCPTNNVVVWFCSLCKKPDVHIKPAINKATFKAGGYECDYYVVHWMWNIVSGELKDDWSMWFGDDTLLNIETTTTIRKKWATYFLRVKSIQCRKL
ncbi:hypothetical protein HKD37_05G013103 [Glycine soja]